MKKQLYKLNDFLSRLIKVVTFLNIPVSLAFMIYGAWTGNFDTVVSWGLVVVVGIYVNKSI